MSLCEVYTIRRFKNIASIARILELFFAGMFLSQSVSYSSVHLPAAVELCGFFLRRLCMLLVSHHFVFLVGNLIVVTLFVKSGHSAAADGISDDDEKYLIGQFVTPNEMMVSCDVASVETISDSKYMKIEVPCASGREDSAVRRRNPKPRSSRRTRSEDFGAKVSAKVQLRRSETEADLKKDRSGEESRGWRMQDEDLSNEEFQRKVEAFIERQQRFLREESLSMANGFRFSA